MSTPVPPSPLRPLAHELRNALAPIRNAAHLLRKRAASDPIVATALTTIDAAITQSLRLLDRAVDAEQVLRGEVALAVDDVDVAALVQQAVDNHASAAREKRQQIVVDGASTNVRVRGDRERLAQVIATLVDNAIGYSGDGAQIRIGLSVEGADAVIRVRDAGIGMAASFLPRVFEPFAQADDSGTRSSSIGHNLPVARKLVELHAGRLDARSDGVGRGSEFTIRLPCTTSTSRASAEAQSSAATASAGATHESAPPIDGPARRVLLVDDNRAVRETYADVLTDLGCDVQTAADGEQALERALAWRPRFVILDINLPKRNGYEVARALRARFAPDEMTLVMISGTGLDESTLSSARAAGFDHCLDKASDVPTLARVLAPS